MPPFLWQEHALIAVMKSTKWVGVLSFVLVSSQSWAFDFDKELEEKPWAEIEVQLPAFPEKENLIPFKVGSVSDTKYLVDSKSISIGLDGVVRYTLVVVSAEGAQTISYEGMRCATVERRFYAFGRSDKTWSKPRSNQWIRIQGSSNNPHVELFANNFCDNKMVSVTSAEDARRMLRNGGISR